jgi:hypothetical protein
MVKKLIEIDRPPIGKDLTDIDWDTMFDEPAAAVPSQPMNKGSLSTSTAHTDLERKAAVEVPKLNVGNKAATRAATANIHPTDAMRDMMGRINIPDDMLDDPSMDDTDDMEDETGEPHHHLLPGTITPDHVPAVIHREIAMTDPHAVNPTWHKVANLPGNMSRAILTLGKALFKAFTNTPTEDIVMIGNVGGQGPNSTREVRSVANWVVKNGKPVDTATIDFDRTIPGYTAEVKHYTIGGIRFKLVTDQFGDYIYAWPEADSVGTAPQIGSPTAEPEITPPPTRVPNRSLPGRQR